ncbi:restriction endonuclease subunit S [Ligilactobacillus salivarius]|uniref:restriction endonuclease subunit S n=2 Tax=Ligilactobacillus salivarius TaxID=1624 RepID=UPI001958D49A|nr:restriction endonuclease subunit S [Ligilactobacillus salivarius]
MAKSFFYDIWEQQELGAVVEFYSGLTYKPENVVQNGTLVIRSSNIHNNQYINADNVYVKDNIVNSEYVQEQDIIVVVRNGSRNLIGKHALLKSIPHDPSVIGAFMTGIRSLNNQFIEAVLNTEKFKREINKNLGATINQITTSQFKKMKFNFPKREEDKQIGILFNYLDDTIQLHERKCEELALIKQALLQKLFPKKDEVIPEVRYKSFSAAWEQRKLGEVIVSEHKGKVKSSMKGGNTNYLETNYLNGGIAQKVNATADVSKNDVLILWDGSKAGTVYHGFEGALGSTLKVYVPKCSGDFLYQILKKDQDKIYQRYRTPNIPHVIKNFTEKFIVSIPNVREQEKIAEFFHDLDSLIALHQRKLEKLKQLKKFLLQNMFI